MFSRRHAHPQGFGPGVHRLVLGHAEHFLDGGLSLADRGASRRRGGCSCPARMATLRMRPAAGAVHDQRADLLASPASARRRPVGRGSRCPGSCGSLGRGTERRGRRRRTRACRASSVGRRRAGSLHWLQISRTRRCATTISTELATRYGSMPMSISRVEAPGASLVCRVLKTRWPVSEACTAMSAVSLSRISPIRTTSGSWRRMARRPRANVRPVLVDTWIWLIPRSWYSTGSSMVMILRSTSLILLRARRRAWWSCRCRSGR